MTNVVTEALDKSGITEIRQTKSQINPSSILHEALQNSFAFQTSSRSIDGSNPSKQPLIPSQPPSPPLKRISHHVLVREKIPSAYWYVN
jgi:hypothetical protein